MLHSSTVGGTETDEMRGFAGAVQSRLAVPEETRSGYAMQNEPTTADECLHGYAGVFANRLTVLVTVCPTFVIVNVSSRQCSPSWPLT